MLSPLPTLLHEADIYWMFVLLWFEYHIGPDMTYRMTTNVTLVHPSCQHDMENHTLCQDTYIIIHTPRSTIYKNMHSSEHTDGFAF